MGLGIEWVCKKYYVLYFVYFVGNVVYVVLYVNKIVDVQWKDFGMFEIFWVCEVKDFGLLIVFIDMNGDNLFEKNKVIFNECKEVEIKKINE